MRVFQLGYSGKRGDRFSGLPYRQFQLSLVVACLSIGIWSQTALAETKLLRSTLSAQNGQSFTELMQQAEAAAATLVEQTFARNSAVTQVSVTILGERNGQETPLLVSSVSRSNWQQQPQIRRWTTYFANFSVALLGYRQPVQAEPPQPTVVAPATATPTAQTPPATPSAPATNAPVAPITPPVRPPAPTFAPSPPTSKDSLKNDPAYRDD